MSSGINRGELTLGLSRFFGVKGGLRPQLEPTLLPIVNVGDVTTSPYMQYGIPVGRESTSAAVAAKFSYVIAQPGQNVSFQAEGFMVANLGAAAQVCTIRMMRASSVAALDTIGTVAQMVDLSPIDTQNEQLRSSLVAPCSDASAAIGLSIGAFTVPIGATFEYRFVRPITLFGNAEGGRGAIAIANLTANEAVVVSWYGREWPLPG